MDPSKTGVQSLPNHAGATTTPDAGGGTPIPVGYLPPMYEYYQTHDCMQVAILAANVKKEDVKIEFTKKTLVVRLTIQEEDKLVLDGTLFDLVDDKECNMLILPNKILLQLPKQESLLWPELFGKDSDRILKKCTCCDNLTTRTGLRHESSVAPAYLLGGCTSNPTVPAAFANDLPEIYWTLTQNRRAASIALATLSSTASNFATKSVKDAFYGIYHGDCYLEYSTHHPKFSPFPCTTMNLVLVSPTQGALLNILFPTEGNLTLVVNHVESSASKVFYDSLTQVQKDALCDRVLHLFLRSFPTGTCIPATASFAIFQHLSSQYSKSENWKDYLDLTVIHADIRACQRLAFLDPDHEMDLVCRLNDFGIALECKGHFHEAGDLYHNIAKKYLDKKKPPPYSVDTETAQCPYDSPQVRSSAAIAYDHAGNYKASEELYLTALHFELARTGGSWSPKDGRTTNLFFGLLMMYFVQQLSTVTKKNTKVDATMEVSLGVLCYAAGFRFGPGEYDDMPGVLKPKLYLQKNARAKLKAAISDPYNVKNFREIICNCAKRPVFNWYDPSLRQDLDPKMKQGKKEAKWASRKMLIEDFDGEREAYKQKCSNPSCEIYVGKDLKFCPCQTAGYCQASCQRTHWKEHKKVCPYHKQKKASK